MVAAGAFSGEVVVWDTNYPEKPLCLSPIEEWAHKEPVMDIEWAYDSARGEHLLCSAGADGKVLRTRRYSQTSPPTRERLLFNAVTKCFEKSVEVEVELGIKCNDYSPCYYRHCALFIVPYCVIEILRVVRCSIYLSVHLFL